MLSVKYSANVLSFQFPLKLFSELKYTKTHEWMKLEGNIATIGITDHAQKELGDIVFIEVPKPNTSLTKGGVITTIETVKTVANVYSPIKGTIIEGNTELSKNQKLLNTSPKEKGWIVKVKVNEEEAQTVMASLLSESQYRKLL